LCLSPDVLSCSTANYSVPLGPRCGRAKGYPYVRNVHAYPLLRSHPDPTGPGVQYYTSRQSLHRARYSSRQGRGLANAHGGFLCVRAPSCTGLLCCTTGKGHGVSFAGCVTACVITLPSLPVSGRLRQCHSVIHKRQGICVKPAWTLPFRVALYRSALFRINAPGDLTRKRSLVRVQSCLPYLSIS
jgi:hypothetical protein